MKEYNSSLRIRICEGNRRLITARDMISTKYSSIGQGRTALKAPMNFKNREEQGNPNGSRNEGGKDLLRLQKQRRGAAEF